MEETIIYKTILEFSEAIDKVRQKYSYCFSDHEILGDVNKIDTKINEIKDTYKDICKTYIEKITSNGIMSTPIELIYTKNLMYNVLHSNLILLMSTYLVETNLILRLDIDSYAMDLIYNNK